MQVTITLNGKKIINKGEIEGLTAIAGDSEEATPGPIILQGDHRPVEFRNVVLTPLHREKNMRNTTSPCGRRLAQRPNPGPSPRPDPAREAALHKIVPLTTGVREDDHPAIASRGGRVWVAWVSYSETEGTSLIYARSMENGKWSAPVVVSETPGDYHKPAITIDSDGAVWIAWPAQVRFNWDIYGRVLRGKWGKTERWTSDAGPDLAPQLASAKDRVLLVWQSMRQKNLDILYRVYKGRGARKASSPKIPPTIGSPSLAVTRDGAFHVAWDSYRGDYDVILRTMREWRWGPEMAVAASPKLENHASLAVDERIACGSPWKMGPEKWAAIRTMAVCGRGAISESPAGKTVSCTARPKRKPRCASSAAKTECRRRPLRSAEMTAAAILPPAGQHELARGRNGVVGRGRMDEARDCCPYSEGRIDQKVVPPRGWKIVACCIRRAPRIT